MAYSDRELLARLIQCEAGGEGEDGMKAVAGVVMNRVHAKGGEYAPVSYTHLDVYKRQGPSNSLQALRCLLSGIILPGEPPLRQATQTHMAPELQRCYIPCSPENSASLALSFL